MKLATLLLASLALVGACSKPPPPAPSPSLTGVWQMTGYGDPEYLYIDDHGGKLIGFYRPSGHQYVVEGTRLDAQFDLRASDETGDGLFHFIGTVDSPVKISGEMTSRAGEPRRLWRAQRNTDTDSDLAKSAKELRDLNKDLRAKMDGTEERHEQKSRLNDAKAALEKAKAEEERIHRQNRGDEPAVRDAK